MDDFAPGTVWLVGAGPGDPELLTAKAARLLGRADVVFYDALVSAEVLALAGDAERVGVGKRAGRHSYAQGSIDEMLVAAALSGRRIVRLKGGDPSIFGRSAEEIAALRAAGCTVRICPGITVASAAAASGCTSLTLRGTARQLSFVTAHARDGEALDLDWPALARRGTTLAVYMGRSAAGQVMRSLIAAGRDPATPVMVAIDVSLPSERVIRGRLDGLAFLVRAIGNDDPTLLLIGEAVAEAVARPAVRDPGAASRLATDACRKRREVVTRVDVEDRRTGDEARGTACFGPAVE